MTDVDHDGSSDQRREHHGPVWERLASEMSKNNLGRHPAEHERHDQAEEAEMVVSEKNGVWRSEPEHEASAEDDHLCPLQEDWGDWQALFATSADDIHDALGQMTSEEGEHDDWGPDVNEGDLSEDLFVAKELSKR